MRDTTLLEKPYFIQLFWRRYWKTSEVSKCFVEYYRSLGYELLPRAPMLDDSIPMSFVMSAGLVQVEHSLAKTQVRDKDKFVLVQDCFRHFDLERVGMDDIHLSLFKMPGAFKFGPNGKVETVERMWHLATSILGINPKKLWVSYFSGGVVEGQEFMEDETVRRAWKQVGMPDDRIVGLGSKDNFWLQGKGFDGDETTRKSGPNTELFYDRGIEKACGSNCLPGCKCGRFIEFSNSLFIRYEVGNITGKFKPLEDPFSETVVGAERVAMILQGKQSVFEIDSYAPLIELLREFSGSQMGDAELKQVGERLIADHLRALVFLIADDAPPPGKNGRQRLIKKLIRGLMTGMILLEISDPEFLPLAFSRVIDSVDSLSMPADEVQRRFLSYYAMQEETFLETIQKGQLHLQRYIRDYPRHTLTGKQMVILEKEWGLPFLLTARELAQRGILVPEAEYKQSLTDWKYLSIA